jgi:catechol 2,3-dioxygenase-like lactoylglutathione lyase family enzyme
MQLRFARHTDRLTEVIRFYRDGLGLPEIGRFENHDGYDGVFLAVPGSDAHLEFTSGGHHNTPSPHPETLLVLYLGSADQPRTRPRRRSAGRAGKPILEATRRNAHRPRRFSGRPGPAILECGLRDAKAAERAFVRWHALQADEPNQTSAGASVHLARFGPFSMDQLWNRGGATGRRSSARQRPQNGFN